MPPRSKLSGLFCWPKGLAVDTVTGSVLIADCGNNVIRRMTRSGLVSTFAGEAPASTPPLRLDRANALGVNGEDDPAKAAARAVPTNARREDGAFGRSQHARKHHPGLCCNLNCVQNGRLEFERLFPTRCFVLVRSHAKSVLVSGNCFCTLPLRQVTLPCRRCWNASPRRTPCS